MLLAVDIGNTHVVFGLYEGSELRRIFRLQTSAERTSDELELLLIGLVERAGIPPSAIDASIVASVVPSLSEPTAQAIEHAFGPRPLHVGPGMRTGLPIRYDDPREVGADRVVNAVAAYARFRRAVIVVDFGTATTFDCISAKGEYLGGAIAPGIRISLDALCTRAAKLPRVDVVKPKHAIGRTTVHSMQSGLVFGYAALVDGLVDRLRAELDPDAAVIGTGGLASLIEPESRTIEYVDECLTLSGLRILYERNSSASE